MLSKHDLNMTYSEAYKFGSKDAHSGLVRCSSRYQPHKSTSWPSILSRMLPSHLKCSIQAEWRWLSILFWLNELDLGIICNLWCCHTVAISISLWLRVSTFFSIKEFLCESCDEVVSLCSSKTVESCQNLPGARMWVSVRNENHHAVCVHHIITT